ncbi:hypothetical protein ACHMW9_24220 [Mesorhizobium terrae]
MDRPEHRIGDLVGVDEAVGVAQRTGPIAAALRGKRVDKQARLRNPGAGQLDLAREKREKPHAETHQAGFHHRLAVAGLHGDVTNLQGEETRLVERDRGRADGHIDIDAGHAFDRLFGGYTQPFRADAGGADRVDAGDKDQKERADAEGDTDQEPRAATDLRLPQRRGRAGRRQGVEIGDLLAPEPDLFVPWQLVIHAVSVFSPLSRTNPRPTL